jgi:hypothetical protein
MDCDWIGLCSWGMLGHHQKISCVFHLPLQQKADVVDLRRNKWLRYQPLDGLQSYAPKVVLLRLVCRISHQLNCSQGISRHSEDGNGAMPSIESSGIPQNEVTIPSFLPIFPHLVVKSSACLLM